MKDVRKFHGIRIVFEYIKDVKINLCNNYIYP